MNGIGTTMRRGIRTLLAGSAALLLGSTAAMADDEPWLEVEMHQAAAEEARLDPDYASSYATHLAVDAEDRLGELQSALEAAHALGALQGVIPLGDGYAIGVYDAHGIWDPFGRDEAGGGDLGGDAAGSSLLFALGRTTAKDPFDVGLPDSPSRSSGFAPDIGGAIAGVAGRSTGSYDEWMDDRGNFHRAWTTSSHGTDTTVDIVFRADSGRVHATQVEDGDGIVSQNAQVYGADGRLERIVRYDRGQGRTTTTYHEDGRVITEQDPEGGELEPEDIESTDELRNPEWDEGGGCMLPWHCDAPWETGSSPDLSGEKRVFEPEPGIMTGVPVNEVAPIATLYDLLVNPGYIDGLYIYDPASPNSSGGVPLDNPHVHE